MKILPYKQKIINYIIVALTVIVAIIIGLKNYLLFHSLIELFSILIAFTIGIITWNTKGVAENSYFTFLGIAYFSIGFFDLFHTLAYKGMGIFNIESANLATQFWLTARYLEAFSLIVAVFFIHKKVSARRILAGYFLLSSLMITLISTDLFPTCFLNQSGLTPFKINSEYLISVLIIISIFLLFKHKHNFHPTVFNYVILAYITTVLGEVFFMFYQNVYDIFNLIGHLFKFVSFYFLYKAIIETALISPYNLLFYQYQKTNEEFKKFFRATEFSPSSIVITDLKGNIEYVNPKFTRITGYSFSEVVGKNPRILQSGLHGKKFYRQLWRTLASGQEWRGEFCNRKKNGELYWEDASISPIKNDQGKKTHYIGIKEDITERKEMEVKLQQAKEMAEKANNAKSLFLAEMSHEIRTPMNGIIGLTELLLTMDSDKKEKRYLEMINNSANLLLNIINDILDLSKIEADKLQLDNKTFNLKEMIEQTLDTFAVKVHNQDVELICDFPAGIPEIVFGDPQRLEQILTNLIGNAAKFTHKGEIVLSVRKKDYDQETKITHLEFQVKDTGEGIEPEDLSLIFEYFRQSTNHKQNGTGLGLAISKRLVELMNGKIGVESHPGSGSNFYFTIPLSLPVSNNYTEKGFSDKTPEILLAESNQTLRNSLKSRLTEWGAEVTTVNSLELCDFMEKDFDIFLIDTNLGGDILYKIKTPYLNNSAYQRKSILLRKTSNCFITQELTENFITTLFKPVKDNELFQSINNILQQAQNELPESPEKQLTNLEQINSAEKINQAEELTILLADDNQVNQELVNELLKSQGWSVDIVDNGYDVVASFKSGNYDLILMDIQMPGISGLEAARKIRELEKNNFHIPIIALTAYAMDEDKQKCLNAGMDDFITKPLKADILFSLIRKYSQKQLLQTRQKQKNRADFNSEINADYRAALQKSLRNLNNNKKLLKRVAEIFLNNYQEQLKQLKTAITEKNAASLELNAHSLKGAVSNLSLEKAYQLSSKLEKMGKNNNFEDSTEIFVKLKTELEKIKKQLVDFNWESL